MRGQKKTPRPGTEINFVSMLSQLHRIQRLLLYVYSTSLSLMIHLFNRAGVCGVAAAKAAAACV